jgi:hypothetical protein
MTTSDKLSTQQVVSCDQIDYGCNGGNTETAYIYIARNGGLELESVYPYTSYYAQTGVCKSNSASNVVSSKIIVILNMIFNFIHIIF